MKKKIIVFIALIVAIIFFWDNRIDIDNKKDDDSSENTEATESTEYIDVTDSTNNFQVVKPTEEISLMGRGESRNVRNGENPIWPLDIPTYIKTNNHAVHPRVIYDEDKKFGYPWIMAFTPYSFMDDYTENPSIVVSENGIDWFIPEGLENPVSGISVERKTHYSDPDIFINGDTIELWYRQSDKNVRLSRILRKTSTNLIDWSEEEILFEYGTGEYGFGAPTTVLLDGEYNLYYRENMSLNTDAYVLRKSTDLVNWTDPVVVNFNYGEEWNNYHAWHIEIDYINGKYYALNMAYPSLDGTDGVLFAFESEDGINFKNPIKVVEPTEDGFDNKNIYKSTFAVKDNDIWLFYSAFNENKQNYIGLLVGPDFMDLVPVNGPERNLQAIHFPDRKHRAVIATAFGFLGVGYGIYKYNK